MPKISIVIPAYNVGDYLQECLDSVRNQTFSDIEAIVVNDASPDNVGEIAARAATEDPRIRVITNNPNMGTHRTRMAGVENASGEYTFFLDGDDALKPDMCEQLAAEIDKHPVDVLHYGLTVVAANELLENERQAFETFNNTPTPDSTGEDIVRDIFDETRGYKVDWRVTQRLYKTSMLKEAFNAMTRDRSRPFSGRLRVLRGFSICQQLPFLQGMSWIRVLLWPRDQWHQYDRCSEVCPLLRPFQGGFRCSL